MLDHVSLGVRDLARAAAFYDAVLAPLGYVRLFTHERAVGYGPPPARPEPVTRHSPSLRQDTTRSPARVATAHSLPRIGLPWTSSTRRPCASVQPTRVVPGLRPKYGPGYYAAFILDLNGHRIEAVCHEPA